MPTFIYEGRDTAGQTFQGRLNAPDKKSALETLREKGLLLQKLEVARGASQVAPITRSPVHAAPLDAGMAPPTLEKNAMVGGVAVSTQKAPTMPFAPPQTKTAPKNAGLEPLKNQPLLRANARDLALFFRQLGALIHAGTGLTAALNSMAKNANGTNLRQIAAQMSERVARGEPMSPQMAAFPGVFSPLHAGIVAAGERGGFLETSFSRLSTYCERDYDLQQTIKRETWYPKLLLAASIGIPSVVPLVLQGVGPWFMSIAPTILAIGAAWWAWKLWIVFEPTIAPNNPVRAAWDRVKLRVPIGGKVARGLATAKFCRALGALYSAGVGIGESVRLSAQACGNLAIKNDVMAQAARLESGETLSSVLGSTRHFPNIAMQMLEVGEQSGDLDSSLEKAADFLEGDAETAVRQALPVLGILAFLIVAFGIGRQIIGFYGGVINEYNSYM